MADAVPTLLHEENHKSFLATLCVTWDNYHSTLAITEPHRRRRVILVLPDNQNPPQTRRSIRVPEQPLRSIDGKNASLEFEKLFRRSL
jgi:hypothetical protein